MNSQRQVFVVYDKEAGQTLSAFPGEPAYPQYLELAPHLLPGQRVRLNTQSDTYSFNHDGSFSVYIFSTAPGTSSEPGKVDISKSSPAYECFRNYLSSDVGGHVMSVAQKRDVHDCIDPSKGTRHRGASRK